MESLAFNLMARIDDLLYVDDATKRRAMAESISMLNRRRSMGAHDHLYNQNSPSSFSNHSSYSSSLTASPFRYSVPVTHRPKRLCRSISQPASGNQMVIGLENLNLWYFRKKRLFIWRWASWRDELDIASEVDIRCFTPSIQCHNLSCTVEKFWLLWVYKEVNAAIFHAPV